MKKTVCELFAGVGGFRLGLKKASDEWSIVWANQWEPGKKVQHAFNCYCHHFGKNDSHVNRDANELPDGQWMTTQSFWINNNYILNQLHKNLIE